jgi:hydroxymethylbilane synthase
MAKLRIGSRGSKLALWQANHVADLLRARGHEVQIEIIKTTGDKITDVALSKVGTKGMFTKEIEEALAEGRVDLAVHSSKDVPTELQSGFVLAAIMKREDPRDAFISIQYSRLEELPPGARVGTSSLRRQCQLKAMRNDLEIVSLRGNVDTRLKKLDAGEYAAIILASAGVRRLGLEDNVRYQIPPELMCPAVGQGALAIEARSGDSDVLHALEFLDHLATRQAIECERALLGALGGGCQVPIGAYAQNVGSELRLRAMVGRPDGSRILREVQTGPSSDSARLGARVAEKLLQRGAGKILQEVYGLEVTAPGQP